VEVCELEGVLDRTCLGKYQDSWDFFFSGNQLVYNTQNPRN